MRRFAWLILSIGLTAGVVGCGDSDTSGTGGSSGTATVSGITYSAALDGESTVLPGAIVSVVGGASTTSGADGTFSLEAPVGTTTFLTTASNAWGALETADVPAEGENEAEPEVIPDALVATIGAALMETIDPGKGIVAVEFNDEVADGGESADLGSNYGFAFVFDADGNPEIGNQLAAGADAIVFFVNVDITSNVMPSASAAGGGACPLDFPSVMFPSQAEVFTFVDVTCP